ncbi:MAG TPA: SGNH/GDSL hydrolase family protein [Edaphobacter sp.]|jgi:phospholipase/lecithinase/hemolysin
MARILILLVIFSFCSVVRAQAPIDRIYVFGDSYSDIGRGWLDSDGPTAVAYMAQRMGLTMAPSNARDAEEKSLDFAVSGAPTGENQSHRVPKGCLGLGMKNQVAEFAARSHDASIVFDPDTTLFFIAGGLNDKKIPTEQTVANLEGEIEALYKAGARRFRVAILPEKIPAFSEVGIRLNPAIRTIPEEMQPKLKGSHIELSQWGAYFDRVMDQAGKYGITDTTNQCAGRAIFDEDATPCAEPAKHFYYHKGHPSTAVHKLVGEMLYREIMAKPATPVAAPKEVSSASPAKAAPSPAPALAPKAAHGEKTSDPQHPKSSGGSSQQ